MLKWFGSGSSHPFSSPRKAKAYLSDLPKGEPLKALEELSDSIESLPETGLAAKAEICSLIDEHSIASRRKLGRDYFGSEGMAQKRIGGSIHRFARLLAGAYFSCIRNYRSGEKGAEEIRDELPVLVCRTIHLLQLQYKWAHLHLGLIEESIWKKLFWLFSFSEKIGITPVEILLYSTQPYRTSIRREFLEMLMVASASPDALSPVEFEIASHVASLLSGHFVLSHERNTPHLTHFVDLSESRPPGRLGTAPENAAGLRFFGPGKAHAIVSKLDESGSLPEEVTLGNIYSIDETRKVLRHLKLHWSDRPVSRRSERRRKVMPIAIAHRMGFDGVETWTSENISDGGFDAIIPRAPLEWEKIGQLFFCRAAEEWDLCIIRRLSRDELKRWHAGSQFLSRSLRMQELRGEHSAVRAAIVHLDGEKMEATVLAEDRGFSPNSPYRIEFEGREYGLLPMEILERGCDFKLWRFLLTRS